LLIIERRRSYFSYRKKFGGDKWLLSAILFPQKKIGGDKWLLFAILFFSLKKVGGDKSLLSAMLFFPPKKKRW